MSGHHSDIDPLSPPRREEVAENVFAYIQPDGTWWINNAGFVAGAEGVVAIDTCATEKRTKAFLLSIGEVTTQPLRTVVNTHHRGDHTHGNYLTYPASIVAHTNARKLMMATGIQHYDGVWVGADWGELTLAPPTITFDDHLTVWNGDVACELHHLGAAAHTTNDVVVWLAEQKVLFTGDLVFNEGTPFVVMGSVSGSRAALQRIRSFEAEVIVPGHGPVCDNSVLDQLDRYFAFVQSVAADAHRSGVSALEAARSTDLGEFAELSDSERIVGNLHRALYEVQGGAPGGPIDIGAAIVDMVAFNGGKPLTCRA